MTAVEWLIEQVEKDYTMLSYDLKKQAKEMEKQQMDKVSGDWFNEGASYMYDGKRKYETFEQYYTSTYGSKGSGNTLKCTCNVDSFLCQIHGTSDGKTITAF